MIPSPPVATYRLQLNSEFGFDAAADVVPYLQSLGISHVYASPFFKARPGSTHGYDILDHTVLNPELGGEPGFLRFSDALQHAGMGLIVDFVPNHMCVEDVRNAWWWNALEFGPNGHHAAHFDIDWHALPGRPRVLLPVLGKRYDDALLDAELQLEYSDGEFIIRYFDHRFPVRPDCYASILRQAARAEMDAAALSDFAARVPEVERSSDREQKAAALKRDVHQALRNAIDGALAHFDRRAGPEAADRMHRLLERQHYRLADWRLAGSQINYRRFFDINSLAGLRVEREETFAALHPLIARLLKERRLQGLRIDHIDGLFDPADYCRRLQALFLSLGRDGVYLIVEKILGEGEDLRPWAGVAGTTGYEWMNAITRTFVDPSGLEQLANFWREISPQAKDFEEVLRSAKAQILEQLFASEFSTLALLIERIAAGHRSTRDLPPNRLREALRAYITEFPIYRTYVAGDEMSEADRRIVDQTFARVRERNPEIGEPILDFLRDALTLHSVRRQSGHSRARVRRFAMKVQQLTGPLMAKSLEDTALYRDHRLLALNEVGNDPSLPPLSVAQFHERLEEHAREFPHGLTATATHDTKRGEDARMRILAIAELAQEWRAHIARWRALNTQHAEVRNVKRAPSVEHEYMLYQAMIGAWPEGGPTEEFVQRLSEYAIKAAREGKQESSWLEPDGVYETGLRQFIQKVCDRSRSFDFLASFDAFAERCALLGTLYSLSQLALKSTMPGVPDFYQGTELSDFSFVDPDNRRRVDFAAHAAAVKEMAPSAVDDLIVHWREGHLKLALTTRLLSFRQSQPELFSHGVYRGFDTGTDDVIAFARFHNHVGCAVIAGRRFARASEKGFRWPFSFTSDREISFPDNWAIQETIIGEPVECGRRGVSLARLGRLPFAVLKLSQG